MADRPTGILICTILFAVSGVFGILMGMIMVLVGAAIFSMIGIGGVNTEVTPIAIEVFSIFSVFIAINIILGILELVVAYGIWNIKRWAKTLGIILAVIELIDVPVGTIIGGIILYFLLIDKDTKDLFV